jgi:hypothetical protein
MVGTSEISTLGLNPEYIYICVCVGGGGFKKLIAFLHNFLQSTSVMLIASYHISVLFFCRRMLISSLFIFISTFR